MKVESHLKICRKYMGKLSMYHPHFEYNYNNAIAKEMHFSKLFC